MLLLSDIKLYITFIILPKIRHKVFSNAIDLRNNDIVDPKAENVTK